jgi:hypothetical protein
VEGTILYLIRKNIVQGISSKQFTAGEFQFTLNRIFQSAVSFFGYIKSIIWYLGLKDLDTRSMYNKKDIE